MPTRTTAAASGSLPSETLVSVCPPRMTAVTEKPSARIAFSLDACAQARETLNGPSCVRMLSTAKIDPPTKPTEYRVITIVLKPVCYLCSHVSWTARADRQGAADAPAWRTLGPRVAMNAVQAHPMMLKAIMAATVFFRVRV